LEKIKLVSMPSSLVRSLDYNIRTTLMELELPIEKKEGGIFFVSAKIIREMIYKIKPALEGWFERNHFDMSNLWRFPESYCELC